MLLECIVHLILFDNLKMLASSFCPQFTPSVLIFLVPFNADFKHKSIASKITAKYSDLIEIQGKQCASTRRATIPSKIADFGKNPAAPYVLHLAVTQCLYTNDFVIPYTSHVGNWLETDPSTLHSSGSLLEVFKLDRVVVRLFPEQLGYGVA
jgi:hypothetical protein